MEEKIHTENTEENKVGHHEHTKPEHKAGQHEHKAEHHDHGKSEHKVEHHREEHVHHSHKVRKSKFWMIVSGILAVILVISIFTGGFRGGSGSSEAGEFIFLGSEACTTACDDMEPIAKDMAEKAGLSFRKASYFQPVQVPGYVLIKDDVVSLNAIQDEAALASNLCAATDGNDICGEVKEAEAEAEKEALKSAEEKCESLEKVDNPKLEVFYVSRCPFGVQAINAMYYVNKNFGDDVEVIPRLLVNKAADGKSTTSMHGEQEHIEDLRHICLQKEQPDVYWDYINCYAESGKSEECEGTAKVDSDKLDDCFENRAEEYALVDAEEWETIYRPKGGSGSPSFFLNGERLNEYEFSKNGRSPENLKTIICCSASGDIEECDNKLQTAQPPRGFGKIEAGSDEGSEQLNC